MISKIKWDNSSHAGWLAQRKEMEGFGSIETVRIGASDVSVITGTNKWKCKRRLFYHLIGLHSTEWRTAKSIGGHMLEGVIASNWESWTPDEEQFLLNLEQGKKERLTKKADFFLLNSKYPNLFVSIDRLHDGDVYSPFTGLQYGELTPIELKSTESHYYKEWPNGITAGYNDQVQTQMMISESEVGVFCVLVNGFYFHVREVEFDKERAEFIDHSVREFSTLCVAGKQIVDLINSATDKTEKEEYQAMLAEIEPEALELEDEQALNKELNPVSDGEIIGSEKDFIYLEQYQDASDKIKALEADKQLAKNKITTLMGDAEVMKFNSGRVTWRRSEEKRDYFSIKVDR